MVSMTETRYKVFSFSVKFLVFAQKMPGSHLGLDTFRGFSYFIFDPYKLMSVKQNNLITPRPLPSTPLPIHYSPLLSNRRCILVLTGPLITSKYAVLQTI
jgi:hypothetical protein